MKNLVVLLMALTLIGTVSAQCGTGPFWGLALTENPYTFSTDADPFIGTDCWGGWDGGYGDDRNYTSGGLLYLDTNDPDGPFDYIIVFNHDNALTDLGVTPGVDKIELVVWVDSISPGANAIVKIEQYPASESFPNKDNGMGAIVTDAWDPDSTITGPGVYSFVTAAVADASAVAVTPVIGVMNGTIVIDEIWIGPEGGGGDPWEHFHPLPGWYGSQTYDYDTQTELTWNNPGFPNIESSTVSVQFEREPGGIFDPNFTNPSTASGINIETVDLASMTNPPVMPLIDNGLYSWRVTVTDPNPGGDPIVNQSWIVTFKIGTPCTYQLAGDLDENCKVNLADFAKLAANWLIDCIDDSGDPACVMP